VEFACLGRVSAAPSLEALTVASATSVLVQEGLAAGGDTGEVLRHAASLFPLHCCTVLSWTAGSTEFTVDRLEPSGQTSRETRSGRPGAVAVLTTLDEEADIKAVRFAADQAFGSPAGCVWELRRFLAGIPGGVMAVQVSGS
jgi:hypothetical protein